MASSLPEVCLCLAREALNPHFSRPGLLQEEDESGFSSRRFWDDRYESTGSTLFDWYQDFDGGLASLLTVRAV